MLFEVLNSKLYLYDRINNIYNNNNNTNNADIDDGSSKNLIVRIVRELFP